MHHYILILVSFFIFSCSYKNQNQDIKAIDKQVLNEEIDDEGIEADLSVVRDATFDVLDHSGLLKLGLQQQYVPEEPYLISYISNNEYAVGYQKLSNEEYKSYKESCPESYKLGSNSISYRVEKESNNMITAIVASNKMLIHGFLKDQTPQAFINKYIVFIKE